MLEPWADVHPTMREPKPAKELFTWPIAASPLAARLKGVLLPAVLPLVAVMLAHLLGVEQACADQLAALLRKL